MINYTSGNLLEANVEALVNTVNCVGIMGKGIALQFKQAYPNNFNQYLQACRVNEIKLGQMFIVPTGLFNPRYIINFPTKYHWRSKSKLKDIETGLHALVVDVQRLNIQSIAIPPLGCGNGGLNWGDVRPLIEKTFVTLPAVQVLLFEPDGAPQPEKMPVAPKALKMTRSRALLIRLLELYRSLGYGLSHLEVQKLAYFLQEAGEPLKLSYEKQKYGPYANNLNHLLQRMEGLYIRGYGDRSQRAEIHPMPAAAQEAYEFLANDPEAQSRLDRVQQLITGFETPYGMELLATVHWVSKENSATAQDVEVAITQVQEWGPHKQQKFQPQHIKLAWKRLRNESWIPSV